MHVHTIPRFNYEMVSGFPNRKETHCAELDEIGRKIRAAIVIQDSIFKNADRDVNKPSRERLRS